MKQIKNLSLREFYNFLTCQIKAIQSVLSDIDNENLRDSVNTNPVNCLRDDITIEEFLKYCGDDDAELPAVGK